MGEYGQFAIIRRHFTAVAIFEYTPCRGLSHRLIAFGRHWGKELTNTKHIIILYRLNAFGRK
jgi:hypothetical protein